MDCWNSIIEILPKNLESPLPLITITLLHLFSWFCHWKSDNRCLESHARSQFKENIVFVIVGNCLPSYRTTHYVIRQKHTKRNCATFHKTYWVSLLYPISPPLPPIHILTVTSHTACCLASLPDNPTRFVVPSEPTTLLQFKPSTYACQRIPSLTLVEQTQSVVDCLTHFLHSQIERPTETAIQPTSQRWMLELCVLANWDEQKFRREI